MESTPRFHMPKFIANIKFGEYQVAMLRYDCAAQAWVKFRSET